MILLAARLVFSPMERFPDFDLYAVLDVAHDASNADIRAAYRRAAMASHPDVSIRGTATLEMARLNVASEILLDRARRDRYDIWRGFASRRAAAPEGGPRARRRSSPADSANGSRRRNNRRDPAPPLNSCPVCLLTSDYGHCAVGHFGRVPRPRFGDLSRFRIRSQDHGGGAPFGSDGKAYYHALKCLWFAEASQRQGRSIEDTAYWMPGRVKQRDRVALDPDVYGHLREFGDDTATRDALGYAVAARVILLARYGDTLASIVCGAHPYGVRVRLQSRDGLEAIDSAECQCPSWRATCKHALATWIVSHYAGAPAGPLL
jgi:hypothetical protein